MPKRKSKKPVAKKLSRLEHELVAKRVVQYFKGNGMRQKNITCRHFIDEGFHRKTILRIIDRYLTTGKSAYNYYQHRPRTVSCPSNVEKIRKLLVKNPSISITDGANKIGINRSTFSRIKLKILGILAYSKQKAPKYKNDQERRARKSCRKIHRELARNKKIIMDDESYIFLDPKQQPGKQYYHAKSIDDVPNEHKFKHTEKFAGKVMVGKQLTKMVMSVNLISSLGQLIIRVISKY